MGVELLSHSRGIIVMGRKDMNYLLLFLPSSFWSLLNLPVASDDNTHSSKIKPDYLPTEDGPKRTLHSTVPLLFLCWSRNISTRRPTSANLVNFRIVKSSHLLLLLRKSDRIFREKEEGWEGTGGQSPAVCAGDERLRDARGRSCATRHWSWRSCVKYCCA